MHMRTVWLKGEHDPKSGRQSETLWHSLHIVSTKTS